MPKGEERRHIQGSVKCSMSRQDIAERTECECNLIDDNKGTKTRAHTLKYICRFDNAHLDTHFSEWPMSPNMSS